jgi:hypothetical protein
VTFKNAIKNLFEIAISINIILKFEFLKSQRCFFFFFFFFFFFSFFFDMSIQEGGEGFELVISTSLGVVLTN